MIIRPHAKMHARQHSRLAVFVTLVVVCSCCNIRKSVLPLGLQESLKKLSEDPAQGYSARLASALLEAPCHIHSRRHAYSCGGVNVWPVSFSVARALLVSTVPPKSQNFSTVIPGIKASYLFYPDKAKDTYKRERDYFIDMQSSLFCFHYKKAGWDTNRLQEILASGAIPIYTDIHLLPQGNIAARPTNVYQVLREWPGIFMSGFPGLRDTPTSTSKGWLSTTGSDSPVYENEYPVEEGYLVWTGPVLKYGFAGPVDRNLYQLTVESLLHITDKYLTTDAMARYVMSIARILPSNKVLYVTADVPGGDYQCDTLLHGFVSVMSTNIVDYPRPPHMWRTNETFTEEELAAQMYNQYGRGFGFTYKMYEPPGVIDRSNIEDRIKQGAFDFIIIGASHRPIWTKLMPLVCSSMPSSKVILVEGSDLPPSQEQLQTYSKCSDYIFSREMPGNSQPILSSVP